MRKARPAAYYRRREAVREPYDVVLIVCEGSKTEPRYFRRLCAVYGLSSANVKILPPGGTDPMTIVTFALAELERDNEYDRAYCVFDRNGHANYEAALRTIRESGPGRSERLVAITSVPCFEVWVLLHFVYSTRGYASSGGLSSCDRVLQDLRRHFPAYAKGYSNSFDDLAPKMEAAITHAKRLVRHNQDTDTQNPSTKVHELVECLINLKSNAYRKGNGS